eukprot:GABV01000348.1.p1 GENE.GABV01000348.1~~GABV01000348.1.p1  ORF type:complete len:219 (-),score=93.96 GABV01000348.1:560-1216(-)
MDTDVRSCRTMMTFMYTGECDLTVDSALPVLSLANRYSVDRLKEICESFISTELSVSNCCLFLSAADRFNCTDLREMCIRFVTTHFETVVNTPAFLTLDRNCIVDIVASDDLLVRCEESVLEAILRWVEAPEGDSSVVDVATAAAAAAATVSPVASPSAASALGSLDHEGRFEDAKTPTEIALALPGEHHHGTPSAAEDREAALVDILPHVRFPLCSA